MKQSNKIIFWGFIAILISFETVYMVRSDFSTANAKGLEFISNLLPIDLSQYNLTLKSYGEVKLPSDIGVDPLKGFKKEVLTYTLESNKGTLEVICTVTNGAVSGCFLEVRSGSVILDRHYPDPIDAAEGFLKKYQSYYKTNLADMIELLHNVDSLKNVTLVSGSLKLTIEAKRSSIPPFGDKVRFRWTRVYNGCEYLVLDIGFLNGVLHGMVDHRVVYVIGDTSVNISKEQAIEIAMEYVKNYSYLMPDMTRISNFNVSKDRAVAELFPAVRHANVLYPYWSVTLYLNETYPGGVYALLVGVWADNGEVFFCNNQAAGGLYPPPDDNTRSGSATTEHSISPYMTALAVLAAITFIVMVVIYTKKRGK